MKKLRNMLCILLIFIQIASVHSEQPTPFIKTESETLQNQPEESNAPNQNIQEKVIDSSGPVVPPTQNNGELINVKTETVVSSSDRTADPSSNPQAVQTSPTPQQPTQSINIPQYSSEELQNGWAQNENHQQIHQRMATQAHQNGHQNWQTLTEEQKQKLLDEQAILSSLHHNPDKDVNLLANMTQPELESYFKKMQEEAKVAYENAMKQMEQKQNQRQEQYQKMMEEEQLTQSQQISHRQSKQFRDRQNKFNPRQFEVSAGSYYRHQFHEYMFELESQQSTDFIISIPVAQEIAFFLYSYTNQDGVYSLATELGNDPPTQVHVIQNNHLLIHKQTFYFRKFVIFQGKEHFTYAIRIINPGSSKLFALSVVHLLQQSHISSTISKEEVASHQARARGLYQQLQQQIGQSQSRRTMELHNQNRLTSKIRTYYIYSGIQMVVIVIVCLLQVKMIQNLLNRGSVV